MITYAYSEKEVKIGETINLGAGFKLPKNSLGYKVKIFVWDSWESKNPISEMTEIEVK
jgi:alpha-glucosidase